MELIEQLFLDNINEENLFKLLSNQKKYFSLLKKIASKIQKDNFHNNIYFRGLLEITNYCENDCYYCGIRKSNKNVCRYKLTKEEILESCKEAYKKGFRTFVLQGGQGNFYTPLEISQIIKTLKNNFHDIAITLSLGESSFENYKLWKDSGADRYLLRHETANKDHYNLLHPSNQKLSNRIDCLTNLKKLNYQVGSGFMVGSPYQNIENIIEDILFLKKINPQMIGIGPYINHKQTPFKNFENGSLELTLYLISILRVLFPNALIPATTALSSINSDGILLGIKSGANVIMPNITPLSYRNNYKLYENKNNKHVESIENLNLLKDKLNKIGYNLIIDKGDYKCIM